MKFFLQALLNVLKADNTIINQLGSNTSWRGGTAANKANSVLPAGKASSNTNTLFITCAEGVSNKLGSFSQLGACWIRVYDKAGSTGHAIRTLAKNIIDLLNDLIIEYNEGGSKEKYQIIFQTAQPIRIDEGFNLDFKELEFSIVSP